MGRTFGYIRVSSREQNLDRQKIALQQLNISDLIIYADKQSGKDFLRPNYKKLMHQLKLNDTLYITSIDRLGRNYDEILEQWRIITKQKRCDIVVLDMPLLDTREKGKDLTGTFVSDLVLQILSYVAETERDNIKKRQAEGIQAAKQRGVKFGRKKIETPENFETIVFEWRHKNISLSEAMKQTGMKRTTFYKYINETNL